MNRRQALQIMLASAGGGLLSSDEVPRFGTFSIVARDDATGEIGVAVQSCVVAVGAIVPYVKAGAGAVATQAFANPRYGPEGLKLLAEGKSAAEVVGAMTSGDPESAQRQLGIIGMNGEPAQFTGAGCSDWAGGKLGADFAVQGNILTGPEVIDAMAESFVKSAGTAPLATRMIAALTAGQAAGGDRRGQQAAALIIEREGWGYAGGNDRFVDLRVDDHPEPITELKRVLAVHQKLFGRNRRD